MLDSLGHSHVESAGPEEGAIVIVVRRDESVADGSEGFASGFGESSHSTEAIAWLDSTENCDSDRG